MCYAQRHSKVSEWGSPRMRECAPLAGPANAGEKSKKSGKREKWKVGNLEMCCAQRHSKVSEWAVQNGFGVGPSVSEWYVQNGCKTENGCAQRHSKVSESGSPRMRECAPLAGPANAGEKSEKSGKQEKWKVGNLGIWKRVMLKDYPKYRNGLSKMDLV
jgi:hypothetical protein